MLWASFGFMLDAEEPPGRDGRITRAQYTNIKILQAMPELQSFGQSH
jgi:hypothetical protein